MGRGLNGADFPLRSASDHGKAGFHGAPFKFGIDFEIAEEFLGGTFHFLAIERLQVGAGTEPDFRDCSGKLGRIAFAVGHSARYRIDDNVFRSGIVLRAVGIVDVKDVARELDKSVLEAAASSEKRPVAPTGELD